MRNQVYALLSQFQGHVKVVLVEGDFLLEYRGTVQSDDELQK